MDNLSINPHDYTASAFKKRGYVLLRGVLDSSEIQALRIFLEQSLDPLVGPAEFEADVGYPGAPQSRDVVGGMTPRRLLHAYSRSPALQRLALHPQVAAMVTMLFGGKGRLSQCHHNCVMTKHPGFSSATLWHQDIRYWSFDQPELISAWYALGDENQINGSLKVIPGSHSIDFDRGRLDRDLFLRPELPINADLIDQAVNVELNAGDVLLFHCRLLHAAGHNRSARVKLSPVFTYHRHDNKPIPGTRSASLPSITLPT